MEFHDELIVSKGTDILKKLFAKQELNTQDQLRFLTNLRILTREKSVCTKVFDQPNIDMLCYYADQGFCEAQKCLSNLLINNPNITDLLTTPYMRCFEQRFIRYLDDYLSPTSTSKDSLHDVMYYDLRIISLMSGLNTSARVKISEGLFTIFIRFLEKEIEVLKCTNYWLILESLKILFNLTLIQCSNVNMLVPIVKKLFSLIGTEENIINELKLQKDPVRSTNKEELLTNLIHLLTNMPEKVYIELSITDGDKIINYLHGQLMVCPKFEFGETLLPILNVCSNICKYNKEIRVKWFEDIMNSNMDFDRRPEESESLRGRLVKLMTSVDVYLKDVSAEFLYHLCDDDADVLITYTGFGNSVAFLSSRRLMKGLGREHSPGEVSSEYKELRNKIDPITGKYESPKSNPSEDMSEEEKEFQAHELAKAITKLNNLGIISTMRVAGDGQLESMQPGPSHKS